MVRYIKEIKIDVISKMVIISDNVKTYYISENMDNLEYFNLKSVLKIYEGRREKEQEIEYLKNR